MSCLVTAGVGITCDALKRVGGFDKRAYIFNLSELTTTGGGGAGFDANGYVNSLQFDTYFGLHKYISRKQAHSGGYTPQIQAPGGNKFFQHDVTLKLFPDDPTEDEVLETLLVSCVGIILEDNNDEFFLYGLKNGMDQSEGVQNGGVESASDMAYSLTFQGAEPEIPKRILITDHDTTLNYLDSLVV